MCVNGITSEAGGPTGLIIITKSNYRFQTRKTHFPTVKLQQTLAFHILNIIKCVLQTMMYTAGHCDTVRPHPTARGRG